MTMHVSIIPIKRIELNKVVEKSNGVV